ncbi:MAG: TIGR03545 family protein [Endomicrobium sp.]|jgi:uncharacterized protein (TIGR03545 family)|nr:TIGR03545 family protein [Endomicrobium sp.]
MKIFRFSFILPAAAVIAAVFIFTLYFLDDYIKESLIFTGESIFGAKVDISSVQTSFSSLGVNISGLKIGYKDDEYKNLIDIDNINFKVRFIPLLSKKIIIDNMSADGVKLKTKRTVSSKLPPKQEKKIKKSEYPSFAQKALTQIKEQGVKEFNAFPSVQKFNEIQNQIKDFSPQSVVDMAGIKSVGAVQNYYVELMGKYDSYLKDINEQNFKQLYEEVSALSNEIIKVDVKTPQDIKKLTSLLSRVKNEKKKVEKNYNALKTIKNSLLKDAKASKTAFKDVNAHISQDVDNISEKLSIPSFDLKGISKMLFGGAWVERVEKVLYYLTIIKKYMPNNSDKYAFETKERKKGRDVSYPLKSVLPKLLISNISLAGEFGGKDGKAIAFSGNVKNITSNQKLIGKAASFEIKGNDAQRTVELSGVFDRLTDTPSDKLIFIMDGLDADGLNIPSTDYTPSFKNAKTGFKAEFALLGSDFISSASVKITGITYNADGKEFENVDKNIKKYLAAMWNGVNSIDVKTGISISEKGGIDFYFSSDIDKILSGKFSSILSSAVGDVKVKIRKEVTQYVESQKGVLQAEADKYAADLQKEIDVKLKSLSKQDKALKTLISKREKDLKLRSLPSLIPKK